MFKMQANAFQGTFKSVFLGLWELLINEQLMITDKVQAAKLLDGSGHNISVGGGGGR